MAGTRLQRILSKTKMVGLLTDRSSPAESTTVKPLPTQADTKPRISFEDPTESRKSSLGSIKPRSMYSTRQDSFASVREDADIPQTFRTIRKPSNESDLPMDFLPRRFESSADLTELAIDDDSDATPVSLGSEDSHYQEVQEEKDVTRLKTLESLPDELLDQIFDYLQLDGVQDDYMRPHANLFSCLPVSKTLYNAALRVLYKNVIMYRSKTFHKLVTTLEDDPSLGSLIQTLDFSHYSQMGYGKSRGQTNVTPYLTKENLTSVLKKTPSLKAFMVHEHLDDELDFDVLSTLFSIRTLRAVDFTSCSSKTFAEAFSSVFLDSPKTQYGQVKRLSLHECTTLKPAVFESILPRLTQLTHLDLAHTRVNDTALLSIPRTAQITHLNLERCTQITGPALVHFLTEHPAAKSIVWLNLNADASRYRMLSAEDLDDLLPALPTTLKSLNIGGARIKSQHVDDLRFIATHVEELGIKGADLSLSNEINKILSLPADQKTKLDHPEMKSTVRYIDLTDVSSVTQVSLTYSPISLKDTQSLPLDVIELGSSILSEISKRNKNVKNPEWTVKELGRRGWYVRSPDSLPANSTADDGYRIWKMGARWWGMRKLPMIEQEVGGMYGYFMFKRN